MKKLKNRYYDLSHVDIQTKKTKKDTGRICSVCEKPIYKIYSEEWVKGEDIRLSKICLWDQYYTCCEDCKKERIVEASQIGMAVRDENGVPLYKKIKMPCWKLEHHPWQADTRRKNGR